MTESLVGNARNGDFIYAASDENSVWVEVRLADNKMSTTIARQIAELLLYGSEAGRVDRPAKKDSCH